MFASTLMLVALTVGTTHAPVSVACRTEKPGPHCPAPGERHEMVGTINGEEVAFIGWHDKATGDRKYNPGENPVLDALKSAAASIPVGSARKNFGVVVDKAPRATLGDQRSNDGAFAAYVNSALETASAAEAHNHAGRPCPGPGPCPNPQPQPAPPINIDPAPEPDAGPSWVAIGGSVVCLIFAGAAGLVAVVLVGVLIVSFIKGQRP